MLVSSHDLILFQFFWGFFGSEWTEYVPLLGGGGGGGGGGGFMLCAEYECSRCVYVVRVNIL